MSKVPGYGEEPPLQGFRRSFTAPHRQLSLHERAGLDNSDADAGLLYQHPAVRIFSFAPPAESIVSKSKERHDDADYPIDTIETLPWRSRTESLMASGLMRIEKIKGSGHFIKCGSNFVYCILRNSQCWCVDGESKFVLRKGKLQYYRIELPNSAPGDQAKVEELKAALSTILKYEKTPCPFKRAFHVDLPDDAITPRRKGKWTRRDDSVPSPEIDSPAPRKWKSSRPPTSYNGPPSAFPDSFNRRRASDYVSDSSTPLRPASLERRRSVAERRAAFENLQSPSQPSSRPRTPASVVSSNDRSHDEFEQSGNEAEPNHSARGERVTSPVLRSRCNNVSNKSPGPVESDLVQTTEEHISDSDAAIKSRETTPVTTDRAAAVEEQISLEQPSVVEPAEGKSQSNKISDSSMADLPPLNMARAISEGLLSQTMTPSSPSPMAESDLDPISQSGTASPQDPQPEPEQETKTTHFLDIPSPGLRPMGSVDTLYTRLLREVSTEPTPPDDARDETESVVSTADSFHTVDTINEEPSVIGTDPTPMAESFDPLGAKRYPHKRDVSEITVTASTFSGSQDRADGDRPGTPILMQSTASDDSWPDVLTPSNDIQNGLRQRIRSRRSFSPLPPSDTVVRSPPTQPSGQVAAALIQKVASFVVVKPIEVVGLVVHILARIAGGATLNDLLSGGLFQRPQEPQRRHARNPSFPDHLARDDDDEDDFGVPIRGRVRSSESASSPQQSRPIDQPDNKTERDTDVDSLFADDLD